MFLIHYGHAWAGGTQKDVEAFVDRMKLDNITMENIYLDKIKQKNPKFTKAQLQDLMKYDKYMTADEAVKLGLADKTF